MKVETSLLKLGGYGVFNFVGESCQFVLCQDFIDTYFVRTPKYISLEFSSERTPNSVGVEIVSLTIPKGMNFSLWSPLSCEIQNSDIGFDAFPRSTKWFLWYFPIENICKEFLNAEIGRASCRERV